ncbi:MAG TPA: STAS/SEC14 domain-containing protein [Alphaproteobacteria bacterium]|nr:STAS/SEC14 domain-containing protein [Alphaproteobacteria bacterium]
MYNILPESGGNVIGIRVKGRMRAQDYETLLPYIDSLIVQHGNVRILSDLSDYEGVEVSAILKTLPKVFKYSSKVEKKAVVTDQHWVYTWAKLLAPFFKTEVRCFPSSEIDKAWKWVRS